LTTVVDACIEAGIYVIIDWHIEGPNGQNTEKAKGFFKEMAQKYGKNNHVLYEGWNEPTHDTWGGYLKKYHTYILSVIRPYSKSLYIAGNERWSTTSDRACADKLDDPNVAYTLHFYAATSAGQNGINARAENQKAIDMGCSVFVTEWGTCGYTGNGNVDEGSSATW